MLHFKRSPNWLPAYKIDKSLIRDTAGSGDWCSAGLINFLIRSGVIHCEDFQEDLIRKALIEGQILAALNCFYEGARGVMYNLSKTEFEETNKIMHSNEHIIPIQSQRHVIFEGFIEFVQII